jgi:hypothetical protein
MSRATITLEEILDEASELALAVAAPWIGILWITSVPLRLTQAHFAARLIELGRDAHRYGDHLHEIATWMLAAFLVSLWGRAIYMRALNLRMQTGSNPGLSALRVPIVRLLGYVYTAALIEVLVWSLCWSIVILPIGVVLSGLAAATTPLIERLSLTTPIRAVLKHATVYSTLTIMVPVYGVALFLAAINLYFVFHFGLWLAGGFIGAEAVRWQGLMSLANRRFCLALLVGGWLAVEPFWLASLAIFVLKMRARASGEDLRLWFARIRESR